MFFLSFFYSFLFFWGFFLYHFHFLSIFCLLFLLPSSFLFSVFTSTLLRHPILTSTLWCGCNTWFIYLRIVEVKPHQRKYTRNPEYSFDTSADFNSLIFVSSRQNISPINICPFIISKDLFATTLKNKIILIIIL